MSFGKTQATSLIPRNFSIFCDNNVFDVLQLYFELLFLKSIVAITKLLNIAQNCEIHNTKGALCPETSRLAFTFIFPTAGQNADTVIFIQHRGRAACRRRMQMPCCGSLPKTPAGPTPCTLAAAPLRCFPRGRSAP